MSEAFSMVVREEGFSAEVTTEFGENDPSKLSEHLEFRLCAAAHVVPP